VSKPEIVVVKLSDSFSDVWAELASDLGAELSLREGAELGPTSLSTAAVVLGAGGAEREALEWLERHDWPVISLGPKTWNLRATPSGRRSRVEQKPFGVPNHWEKRPSQGHSPKWSERVLH
jgi:hypothetical protein